MTEDSNNEIISTRHFESSDSVSKLKFRWGCSIVSAYATEGSPKVVLNRYRQIQQKCQQLKINQSIAIYVIPLRNKQKSNAIRSIYLTKRHLSRSLSIYLNSTKNPSFMYSHFAVRFAIPLLFIISTRGEVFLQTVDHQLVYNRTVIRYIFEFRKCGSIP